MNKLIITDEEIKLEESDELIEVTISDKLDMIKKHYLLLKKYNNEKVALLEIRMHALWYIKGIPGVKKYKSMITNCSSESEFFEVINSIRGDADF